MSEYYFSKKFHKEFNDVVELVRLKLPEIGFGIITEIDLKETFKKKLDVNFRNYKILGACHPQTAYSAIQTEDKIGTMLPCNIIVQELEKGEIEVAAVDPVASMASVQNMHLAEHAYNIRKILKNFIADL
ncbi:MAG TPA: DUF302 domain-containing protein [Candidatus Kapabacteria bacterium]|nr:DUF302 domain-containing protein [Candidatus Kapabacteria bacterium]